MVRLVWVGLAIALAGCPSCLDVKKGRQYPCEMDSGLPTECPDQWRCGLEPTGQPRCHAIGTPGPYLCTNEEACEGWHCGTAGACYDRSDAGAIACRADAGDCADTWRCGLENVCHPIGQPAAFLCRAETDCEGWHCGLDAGCYDRTIARAVSCRANVPFDCADGWRCGVTGVCQDRDAGGPYPCADDSHCERGWRCSPQGACVDASSEALRDAGAITIAALPVNLSPSGLFALTHARVLPEAFGATIYPYATSSETGLLTLVNTSQGPFRLDAGARASISSVERVQLPAVPWSLTTSTLRAFAASDAGLHRFTVGANGPQLEALPIVPGVLALDSNEVPRRIAAWTPSQVTFFDETADAGVSSTTDGGAIIDFKWQAPSNVAGFAVPWPSVVTASGMYVAPRGPAGYLRSGGLADGGTPLWLAVQLPNGPAHAACSTNRPTKLRSIWPVPVQGQDYLLAERESPDGGEAAFLFYSHWFETPAVGAQCGDQGWTLESECQICRGGERPIFARSTSDFRFRMWCQTDAGIAEYGAFRSNGSVSGRIGGLPDGGCSFGRDGVITGGAASTTTDLTGFLDRDGVANVGFYPIAGFLQLYNPPVAQFAGSAADGRWAFDPSGASLGKHAFIDKNVSVVAGTSLFTYCGRIDQRFVLGREGAASSGIGVYDLERGARGALASPSALLDQSEQLIDSDCTFFGRPRAAGTTATLRDGGTMILAGARDSVWAFPSGQIPPGDAFTVAPVRLVPLPGLRLTALTAVAVGSAADEVTAYAIQGSRLFQLRAETLNRWFSTEIALPVGDPLGLWSDGPNGRVGYTDGRVYSLPLRLQIAGTLPSPALAFGQVCGHGYALTESQLFRLVPRASDPIGTWEPVSLAGTGLTPPYTNVLLSEGRGELLLSQSGVKVARLADPSCGP